MIEDDLPTNPEYLDESFGAAAGLRELQDEDLFDSDAEDGGPSEGQRSHGSEGYVKTSSSGETIKMLVKSMQIIEHFYETLPPYSEEEDLQ